MSLHPVSVWIWIDLRAIGLSLRSAIAFIAVNTTTGAVVVVSWRAAAYVCIEPRAPAVQ